MDNTQIKQFIEDGHLTVGIEFGSTRIKAIAIDEMSNPRNRFIRMGEQLP